MKINWKIRLKNPYFWLGLIAVILSAMGVSAETLTSWNALKLALYDLVSNPYMIGCVIVAVLGIVTDPTTKGLGDSERALSYGKEEKKWKQE